jgi:hypothetical protein
MMSIANEHNLHRPLASARTFGIRVRLPRGDTFRALLGEDWERVHWYGTESERDAALADMSRRHEYSRLTDAPRLVFEKTSRAAGSEPA